MKSRRNVVAVFMLLAVLAASPAAAEWDKPDVGVAPSDASFDDMITVAHWSLQIAQAAF